MCVCVVCGVCKNSNKESTLVDAPASFALGSPEPTNTKGKEKRTWMNVKLCATDHHNQVLQGESIVRDSGDFEAVLPGLVDQDGVVEARFENLGVLR